MNSLFISGMARSGTTLLDKLLSNHPEMDVLSQPFPLLFVDIKKKFLKSIGIEKYYVLNDEIDQKEYSAESFKNFLDFINYSNTDVESIFELMEGYNGQYTKPSKNRKDIGDITFDRFDKLYKTCLGFFKVKNNIRYIGVKEPLCEEYIPYVSEKGFKSIIIIRDPRDVLASANYPKGEKHLGIKKPTLFLLRSWRKSVEFARLWNGNKNFHFLKYEDLVMNPYNELDRITSYLGLPGFNKNCFDKGIYNQNGDLWSANSSFHTEESFISKNSLGVYKEILTKEEIDYTEAICGEEMIWLGYNVGLDEKNKGNVIRNFKDFDIEDNPHLSKKFSSEKNNVEFELSRLKLSTSGD